MNTNWNSRIHTISTSISLKLYPSPWFLASVFLVILFSLAFLWAAISRAGQNTALSKSMLTGHLFKWNNEWSNGWLDGLLKWPYIPFLSAPVSLETHPSHFCQSNPLKPEIFPSFQLSTEQSPHFSAWHSKPSKENPLTHSLALSAPALALLKCSHPKTSIPQPQTALVLQFLMATCSSCLAASCSRFVQLGTHICPFHPPWPRLQTLDLFPPWSPPRELCQTLVHPAGLTHFVFSTGHCTHNTD